MHHDAVASVCWDRQYEEYPDLQLWLVDDDDRLHRRVECRRSPFGPGELPDDGWDAALRAGVRGRAAKAVSAIAISVGVDQRGEGPQQGDARRDAEGGRRPRAVGSRRAGASEPEAPLPARSDRALHRVAPRGREAARSVAARARGCGREADPGRAASRCGSQARSPSGRTGRSCVFPETGTYVVPGALVPVEIDRERDEGVYVEPNVWMHHRSRPGRRTSSPARSTRPSRSSESTASRSSVSSRARLRGDLPEQQRPPLAERAFERRLLAERLVAAPARRAAVRERADARSEAHARGTRSRRGRRAPAARPARTRVRCAPGSARRSCRRAAPARRTPGCGSRPRCRGRRPGAQSGPPASLLGDRAGGAVQVEPAAVVAEPLPGADHVGG